MPELPWVRVRASAGVLEVEGSPSAELGHRIARPAGGDDGLWAAWHWDGRRLVVETERYGMYPVYYHATESEVVASPDIFALLRLGVPRALDEDALAGFLGFGSYLGDDTPFAAIRVVPPNGQLCWSAEGWTVTGHRTGFTIQPMTRSTVIDGAIELVREAAARRVRDEPGCIMPISGGRDSRHILLELIRQGHPPRLCVTAFKGFLESDNDALYAARLCAELGIPHRVLERPYPLVAGEKRKNALTSLCADEHAWYLRVAEALDGETYTYDGLAGGTLLERTHSSRPKVRRLMEAGRIAEAAYQILRTERGAPRFVDLVAPGARSWLSVERAAARVQVEVERYMDRDDPLGAFYYWNRAGRELNLIPALMLAHVPTVYAPFQDHDVFDLLSAVPIEHIDHDLHNEILAAAFPEASHIPLVPKGPAARPARSWFRRVNLDLAGLLGESSGRLVDRAALRRTALRDALIGGDSLVGTHRASLITYLVGLEGLIGDAG